MAHEETKCLGQTAEGIEEQRKGRGREREREKERERERESERVNFCLCKNFRRARKVGW